MSNMIARVQGMVRGLRAGRAQAYWEVLHERWHSERVSFGLRRDLSVPFPAPDARIPITVRPLRASDMPQLLALDTPDLAAAEHEERLTRRDILAEGLATCYVAVTADDTPCYMQWLIGPGENDRVQAYFHGIFPRLAPDEALLEGAYTPEAWRGQRIMPCAMAHLAEQGTALGARWVITFVTQDNVPSLKGCQRAGFVPYLLRKETWHRFRRRLTFTPLPAGTPYPFDAAPAAPDQSVGVPGPAR
jgi:hypothetical protein